MSVRRALLVGINAYSSNPLRGCVNDVMQMKGVLENTFGFAGDDFQVLLDDKATQAGIKSGLEWLAQGGGDADAVRVFHFSGHGTYVADTSGDEPDGRDECLVPYDYKTEGFLTDDVLKTLYDKFPRAGNLTLIIDSCHSGSVQKDLAEDIAFRFLPITRDEQRRIDAAARKFKEDQEDYVIGRLRTMGEDPDSDEWEKKVRGLMKKFEKVRYGDVRNREANILLAGCRADQQSADAKIAGDYHGAFTYFLAKSIEECGGQVSYRELAEQTATKLGDDNFTQIPQLECRAHRDQRVIFKPFI